MSKKKNVNVNVEVNTPVEEMGNEVSTVEAGMGEVEEISGKEEMTAAVEVKTGDGSVEPDGTATAEGEGEKDPRVIDVTLQGRNRRQNGEGSIYPIYKDGDKSKVYRWGYCLQLGKSPSGKLLRHLETAKTLEEITDKLETAKQRYDELRTIHLEKAAQNTESNIVVHVPERETVE